MENENNLVVMSNELIEGNYASLDDHTMKLMLWGVAQIKTSDQDFYTLNIHEREYKKISGMHIEAKTKEIIKKFRERGYWIELSNSDDKDEVVLLPIFHKIKFNFRTKRIEFEFNQELKPHLLGLKGLFTKHQLECSIKLKNKYAIRLYQLCIRNKYRQGGKFNIDLLELKSKLGIEDFLAYKVYYEFKRRILDPCVKDINKHSDINIKYAPKKLSGQKGYQYLTFEATTKAGQEQTSKAEVNSATHAKERSTGLIFKILARYHNHIDIEHPKEISRLIYEDQYKNYEFVALGELF